MKYASQSVWLVTNSVAVLASGLWVSPVPFPHRIEQAWAVARGRQGEAQAKSGPGPHFSTYWWYPALTRKRGEKDVCSAQA